MGEPPAKRNKAHGQEKDWFMMLMEVRFELEGRCCKAEERIAELEKKLAHMEMYAGEPRRIGSANPRMMKVK